MKLVKTDTGEMTEVLAALVPSIKGAVLIIGAFKFGPDGMTVHGEPPFDEWLHCGSVFAAWSKRRHFGIGDWLLYGERTYGEKYAQALDLFGYEYSTLSTDKWVAKSIPPPRRRENLPWSFHREVAPDAPAVQERLLSQAEEEQWDRDALRQKRRELRNPDPKAREKHIVGVSICCDLLFGDDREKGPLVQIDHVVEGSPLVNSAFYRPGWKSVDRLIQTANDRVKEGWVCRPVLIYGTIGWTVKQR